METIDKKVLLTKPVIHWMNMNYSPDQLEIVTSEKYPDSIFYKKNGKFVMEQDEKNKNFWFDYDTIWSFFEEFFGLEYKEIQGVLKSWLEETLKLEGYTATFRYRFANLPLEETLKLEGYTACPKYLLNLGRLEETLKLEGYTADRLRCQFNSVLEDTIKIDTHTLTINNGIS